MAGLKDFKAAAVLRAENLDRARDFYRNVLGLEEIGGVGPTGQGMFTAGDNTVISLYERPGMPAPQNTTLAFAVPADQFDAVMSDLKERGVTFEDYDIPETGLKTENGVAQWDGSKSAWFLDTEGNILSINTM